MLLCASYPESQPWVDNFLRLVKVWDLQLANISNITQHKYSAMNKPNYKQWDSFQKSALYRSLNNFRQFLLSEYLLHSVSDSRTNYHRVVIWLCCYTVTETSRSHTAGDNSYFWISFFLTHDSRAKIWCGKIPLVLHANRSTLPLLTSIQVSHLVLEPDMISARV